MRKLLVVALLALLAGCTTASMAGFNALAVRADTEIVDITGVPAWQNGGFTVGAARGVVRRVARSDAMGWGYDRIASRFDTVEFGVAARYGRFSFAIERADLGGLVEGRCGYSREEVRDRIDDIRLAAPLTPLRLDCDYRIAGRDVGMLELDATDGDGGSMAERRTGRITLNGTALRLRSAHGVEGVQAVLGEPTGYVMTSAQNRAVGAVELTSGQSRRVLVPRTPDERAAVLVAAITLGLFWDPGDVG